MFVKKKKRELEHYSRLLSKNAWLASFGSQVRGPRQLHMNGLSFKMDDQIYVFTCSIWNHTADGSIFFSFRVFTGSWGILRGASLSEKICSWIRCKIILLASARSLAPFLVHMFLQHFSNTLNRNSINTGPSKYTQSQPVDAPTYPPAIFVADKYL